MRNPSWLAPYIGCYVVAIGMYLQFRLHLVKFLGKRLGTAGKGGWGAIAARVLEIGVLGYLVFRFTHEPFRILLMKKWLPWIITALFAIYALKGVRPAKVKDFDWQKFGSIPVMANGRFQPLDSLARNSLLQLREKGAAISSTVLNGPDKQAHHARDGVARGGHVQARDRRGAAEFPHR